MTKNPAHLITLFRGDSSAYNAQARARKAAVSVKYTPITGRVRTMDLLNEQQERLQEAMRNGCQVVCFDDVYSTGATVWAMREIVQQACGMPSESIPIVTVIRECPIGDFNQMALTGERIPNLYYAARTPVVPDGQARDGLAGAPFMNRVYDRGEIEYLRGIASRTPHIPAGKKARLALAGMLNLPPAGFLYLANGH